MNLAKSVYDYLDIGKSPRPADCIFVPAGRQDRKIHAVTMWRFGYAAQLILSVNNLETKSFSELNLDPSIRLEAHEKQHFLVRLDRQESFCTEIRPGFLELRAEARELAKYLRDLSVRSMLVVSSPMNTRRVALVFGRALRKSGILLTFVSAPEKPSFDSSAFRAEIWAEFRKYIFYRIFFL